MMMFFIFFVFQALLNFIPFQLKTFSSTMGYGKVGMMYAGYIIGFIISIGLLIFFKQHPTYFQVGGIFQSSLGQLGFFAPLIFVRSMLMGLPL